MSRRRYFLGARPGRKFRSTSVFSRRRRRYICLQLEARLVLALLPATLSSAFKHRLGPVNLHFIGQAPRLATFFLGDIHWRE